MNICDPTALEVLSLIEGASWLAQQERDKSSSYGFYAWLVAAQQALAAGGASADVSPRDFIEGGDGAIYGEGGWHRYRVCADGEVVLLNWSATPERRAHAAALGIRVG